MTCNKNYYSFDSKELNLDVNVENIKNPRKEAEHHYYNPDNQNLRDLGYHPSTNFEEEIEGLINALRPFKKRILEYGDILKPTIKW